MSRFVYGIHPVEELIRRGRKDLQALFVARDQPQVQSLVTQVEALKIDIKRVDREELDGLVGDTSHQGICALVGDFVYCELEALFESKETPALVLVADSIQDPQNLGAMLRSALALGATGVVIPKDRAVGITPTVVRVSSGASEHLKCARVTNLARALEELKEAGIWIAGTVEKGGEAPDKVDFNGPMAIVMGNEQKGMRPLVQRGCDYLITIPTGPTLSALNVGAATAIVLYEASRQRLAKHSKK